MEGSVCEVRNSTLWENRPSLIEWAQSRAPEGFGSNLEGHWRGEGNIFVDPIFVSPELRKRRLASDSPSIDAGSEVDSRDVGVDGGPRPIGDGNEMDSDEVASCQGEVAATHADEASAEPRGGMRSRIKCAERSHVRRLGRDKVRDAR